MPRASARKKPAAKAKTPSGRNNTRAKGKGPLQRETSLIVSGSEVFGNGRLADENAAAIRNILLTTQVNVTFYRNVAGKGKKPKLVPEERTIDLPKLFLERLVMGMMHDDKPGKPSRVSIACLKLYTQLTLGKRAGLWADEIKDVLESMSTLMSQIEDARQDALIARTNAALEADAAQDEADQHEEGDDDDASTA
jgi:hypothetical protein